MPLLDHFHPPLFPTRSWQGLHGQWAGCLANLLNGLLPVRYFAEPLLQFGNQVEIDVATMEDLAPAAESGDGGVGTVVAAPGWAPAVVVPAVFSESLEVLVLGSPHGGDRVLVAAIELVSPSNKHGPEMRRAFAIKCASYLQAGCGPVVVDVVTSATFCLHNDLADLLHAPAMRFDPPPRIYATAYHPVRRSDDEQIEVWREPLTLGESLPRLPLFVRGLGPLTDDLEGTYQEACARNRLLDRDIAGG